MFSKLRLKSIDYLDGRHFLMALAAAFLLHMLAVGGYYLAPHTQVVDIPVRALNVRLGDADIEMQEAPPQPAQPNAAQVEESMGKLVRPQPQEKPLVKEQPKTMPKTVVAKPVDTHIKTPVVASKVTAPRQYVRDTRPEETHKGSGSVLGNSTQNSAEIRSRYEQTISLWIQKFMLYPDAARAQALQGSTTVRIRIDRRGNIRYCALEQSTGHPELDAAALDMVRRANPVPAVPGDYPAGELFEFLIPVNFQMR